MLRNDPARGLTSSLTPVDGGDVYEYDVLSRPTSIAKLTPAGDIDPATRVTFADYSTLGLPEKEQVGWWPSGGRLDRRYDDHGNLMRVDLPQGLATSVNLTGYARQYDLVDRPISNGAVNSAAGLAAGYDWGGRDRPYGFATAGGLGQSLGYANDTGLLAGLATSGTGGLAGRLAYGWDADRGLKTSRHGMPAGLLDATATPMTGEATSSSGTSRPGRWRARGSPTRTMRLAGS